MVLSESAHCAIVVVVELISHYNKRGVSYSEISTSQHIPVPNVKDVAQALESAGVISLRQVSSGETLLYLNKEPEALYLEDIVKIFDKSSFAGVFADTVTGKVMPQSHLSRLINSERKYINQYLKNRYRRIGLVKWAKYTNKERREIFNIL